MPEEPDRIDPALGDPLAGAEWNPAKGWYVRFLETPGYEHAISISAPWDRDGDTLHTPLDDARRLVAAVQAALTWADVRISGGVPRAGSLGDRLRQLRTMARLDVDELARCFGWESNQVRSVEADEIVPSAVEIGMWVADCQADPATGEALEQIAARLRACGASQDARRHRRSTAQHDAEDETESCHPSDVHDPPGSRRAATIPSP